MHARRVRECTTDWGELERQWLRDGKLANHTKRLTMIYAQDEEAIIVRLIIKITGNRNINLTTARR